MSAAAVPRAPAHPASSARPRAYQGPARGHDHDDRDAVLCAFSMSTPYHAAQTLGLSLAPRQTPRLRSVRVLCPWHSDRAPSCDLTIKRGRLVARCRSCGEGGDVLSIVAAIEGLHARRDFGLVLQRAADLVGVDVRAARRAPVGPLSPIDELRIQLRDARAETARIEAEARALREALAVEQAERAAQGDALREVIGGLSEALVGARAALRGLATVAARGTRAEVQAAVRAIAPGLGLDDNDIAQAGLLPDDPAEGAGPALPVDALVMARAAMPALEAAARGTSRPAVMAAIGALKSALEV